MEKLISITTFTDPEIEKRIIDLKNELGNYTSVQAAADAKRKPEIPQSYYTIQIVNYVEAKTQSVMNFIRTRLLNLANIGNAKEADQMADAQNQELAQQINDLEHIKAPLQTKRDSLPVNHFKRKYAKWLIGIVLTLGLADGIFMFVNIAGGGYPIPISFLGAVVLACIISFGHVFYVPWMHRASSSRNRALRLLLIFILAFVIFSLFGNIRAASANNTVDVAIPGSEVSTHTATSLNGWVIAAVSFGAFLLVHFLSALFYKNEQELKVIEQYNKLTKEIADLEATIHTKQEEQKVNKTVPTALKQEARFKHNLFFASIKECKGIANASIINYQQIFTRHSETVPAFFSEPTNFHFDDGIDF